MANQKGEEEKWFSAPEWEGERVTEVWLKVTSTKLVNLIQGAVEGYLNELGIKENEPAPTPGKGQRALTWDSWKVDMSTKTFYRVRTWEMERYRRDGNLVPIAYPSQLPLYMGEKRAFLAVKRFGI